jgi:hypothetical protein
MAKEGKTATVMADQRHLCVCKDIYRRYCRWSGEWWEAKDPELFIAEWHLCLSLIAQSRCFPRRSSIISCIVLSWFTISSVSGSEKLRRIFYSTESQLSVQDHLPYGATVHSAKFLWRTSMDSVFLTVSRKIKYWPLERFSIENCGMPEVKFFTLPLKSILFKFQIWITSPNPIVNQ